MLVRRAVVPAGKRRSLAGLPLARRRVTAGDAAVEESRLDLLLDERGRSADTFTNGPGDLRLRRDREVAPDVREEGPVGAREVVRILGEPGHRALAFDDHLAPVDDLLLARDVRVDEVLDRAVDRSRVLIHTRAKLSCVIVHVTSSISPDF